MQTDCASAVAARPMSRYEKLHLQKFVSQKFATGEITLKVTHWKWHCSATHNLLAIKP